MEALLRLKAFTFIAQELSQTEVILKSLSVLVPMFCTKNPYVFRSSVKQPRCLRRANCFEYRFRSGSIDREQNRRDPTAFEGMVIHIH